MLSILIIPYNTRDLTLACLRSIYGAQFEAALNVIVLDNASTDGSADAIAEQFPQVHLIRSSRNLGFSGGNNLAAQYASREWLLLLNPDTVVLDGSIQKLLAFAEQHPEGAIFGGRTLFADGSFNPSSCHGRPTPWSAFCIAVGLSSLFRGSRWFDPESLGPWGRDTVREVDCVTGCFLLIRRSIWEQLGGFDESFFMYGEETDLCLRARKLGHKCMICPDATIIHYGGASEKVRADKMVKLFTAKALLFERHWDRRWVGFGIRMLDLWALTRVVAFWAVRWLGPARKEAYQTWRSIWLRRHEWRRAGKRPHPDGAVPDPRHPRPGHCAPLTNEPLNMQNAPIN
jgi:GT2 family glycosyltransferase